jgi:hypothetical protein
MILRMYFVVTLFLCFVGSVAWGQEIGGPGVAQNAGGEAAGGSGPTYTISGVPAYLWYNGCGPTSAGMIIGFWDAHGCDNLIPGSNSWSSNQTAVKAMIASPGHISDYSLYNGIDDSNYASPYSDMSTLNPSAAHASNCVADFSQSSFSSRGNKFGWSYFSDQDNGLKGYATYKGYQSTTYQRSYALNLWTETMSFLDAGKPVQFLVDSSGDGGTDHFVTVIGYDNTPGALRYECYNTWDTGVHWYNYGPLTNGTAWGVYGGTFFTPVPEPGTLALLAIGIVVLLMRKRISMSIRK